jgi:allantoicase
MFDLRAIGERIVRVRRVGHNLGVDIDTAVAAGAISPEAADAMVRRCLTCEAPEDCTEWLENYPDGAREPPAFCRNRNLFQRLVGRWPEKRF